MFWKQTKFDFGMQVDLFAFKWLLPAVQPLNRLSPLKVLVEIKMLCKSLTFYFAVLKRINRRGSEWEIVEGLKDGQRFDKKPEVYTGYLHKKRKWPLKGWHKVSLTYCYYFFLKVAILLLLSLSVCVGLRPVRRTNKPK